MAEKAWSNLHRNYQTQEWIDKPSLFAETAIAYFPKGGRILELGAGQGQDSRYFADHGFRVVSTDLEQSTLDLARAKVTPTQESRVKLQLLDLRGELPFGKETFDVVYAHLSLHYFDRDTTVRIFDEAARVLKPSGILAFLVNSVKDPEYSSGKQIEPDYFQIDSVPKRYFNVTSTLEYVRHHFETNLLDDHGETYKDAAKGVHNLVRFIGTKRPSDLNLKYAIPYVGAIIERERNGQKQLLMQTRWKPHRDPVYSGTLDFPAGTLDHLYENVYETLAREIKEETGLTLKNVTGDSRTRIHSTSRRDEMIGFRPFCCTQQLKNGKPWVGFVFLCEVEPGEPKAQVGESKDVSWMAASEVRKIFERTPEELFGLELPAWEYYFSA